MDARRKKLLYRSQHCGMKENDILLGRFAGQNLEAMSDRDLREFETLLDESDPDLHNWITGREPLPGRMKTPLMSAIITFNRKNPQAG